MGGQYVFAEWISTCWVGLLNEWQCNQYNFIWMLVSHFINWRQYLLYISDWTGKWHLRVVFRFFIIIFYCKYCKLLDRWNTHFIPTQFCRGFCSAPVASELGCLLQIGFMYLSYNNSCFSQMVQMCYTRQLQEQLYETLCGGGVMPSLFLPQRNVHPEHLGI